MVVGCGAADGTVGVVVTPDWGAYRLCFFFSCLVLLCLAVDPQSLPTIIDPPVFSCF